MKKQYIRFFGFLLSITCLLAGCGEKSKSGEKQLETGAAAQTMKIYYMDGEEIVSKEETQSEISPEDVWEALQAEGILTDECAILDCAVNSEEKKIDLDVNAGFGKYLKSMGTTGESEILTCVVNSYLESFSCEGIKITEEGQTLETGHAVLDGYMRADEQPAD